MWYVYILKDKQNKFYIGSTNDLKRRLEEHHNNQCNSMKRLDNMNLEAYIAVKSEEKARSLEQYFKTGSGKVVLNKRILSSEVLMQEDLSIEA